MDKPCTKALYYRRNRARILALRHAHFLRNRNKILKRHRQYYLVHKKEIIAVSAKYKKKWLPRNKQLTRKYQAKYRQSEKGKEAKRRYRRKTRELARLEALKHYGGKCYCCGEDEPLLLGLDHKNNDGARHKEHRADGNAVWAKRHGWPSFFQLACHSCNLGRHLNHDICPHQDRKRKT